MYKTPPGKPSVLFFKAIVAGFRGKVAQKNWTLSVPGCEKRGKQLVTIPTPAGFLAKNSQHHQQLAPQKNGL